MGEVGGRLGRPRERLLGPGTASGPRAGRGGFARRLPARATAARRPAAARRRPSRPPRSTIARSSSRIWSACARPVKRIVVDVVVDRDVGAKLVVQVEVMRVRHHQPAPPRRRLQLPPRADRPRDRPHPQPGKALHPAARQDELLLPGGGPAPPQPAGARPGIEPAPPAVDVIQALEQQDRRPTRDRSRGTGSRC